MPRARQIKYGFFIDDELAELPPLCRILFEGLWLLADREGKLEDRPKKIHAQILPYDANAQVDEYLNMLQDAQKLRRYAIGDAQFIKILNFCEHQNPHQSETESKIPEPETQKHDTNIVEEQETHTTNPACNLLLNAYNIKKEKTSKKKKSKNQMASQFEDVYKNYSVHKDKQRAWIAFQKLAPSDELLKELLQAIENQKQEKLRKQEDGKFVAEWKYLSTWLNQKCWTDEIEQVKPKYSPWKNCKSCGKEISKVGNGDFCTVCDDKHSPKASKKTIKNAIQQMKSILPNDDASTLLAECKQYASKVI